MPVQIGANDLRKSEFILRIRGTEFRGDACVPAPLLRQHPSRSVSPVERKWGLEQKQPTEPWEPVPFNTGMGWRYKGRLNIECLAQAANEMIVRHPILRCTLKHLDGGWRYLADHFSEVNLYDLVPPGASSDAGVSAIQAVNEFIFRPFDLAVDGPFRIGYARISDSEYVIGFAIHHSFTDGYSNRIFSFELAAFYEALCRNKRPLLKELPLSFFDYLFSIEDWAAGADGEVCKRYWSKYLEGAGLVDYKRSETLSMRTTKFPAAFGIRVREICAAERVGVNMFWEVAHHIALYRLLGCADVTTLSVDAGRRQSELTGMMGQIANLLPCRSTIYPDLTLRELIRSMHMRYRDSVPHRSMPYDFIAEGCPFSYAASFGHLNFMPQEFRPLASFGDITAIDLPEKVESRLIYPYAMAIADGPEVVVGCSGHIHEPFTIEALLEMLCSVATALASDADSKLSALSI